MSRCSPEKRTIPGLRRDYGGLGELGNMKRSITPISIVNIPSTRTKMLIHDFEILRRRQSLTYQ